MTGQRSILTNFLPINPKDWTVAEIGGTQLTVHGQGDVKITSSVKGTTRHGKFQLQKNT